MIHEILIVYDIMSTDFRVGHHSTSDDSSAYRSVEEVEQWKEESPLIRFRLYLENNNWWSDKHEKEFVASAKKQVQ